MKSDVLTNCLSITVVLYAFGCASQPQSPPTTVTVIESPTARTETPKTYVYDQKVETSKTLFNADKSRKFISEFGALYVEKGKPTPTFAIRINPMPDGSRSLPNEIRDEQARADCVRYFGRPLREGGIKLVDEAVNPGSKVDIVLNALVSWRTIQITGFNGEKIEKSLPDVQVAAIRVADGVVLGQAGTTDLIGLRQDSWVTVERVGVPEVMRATALVLLEDMVARKFTELVAAVTQAKATLLASLPPETKPAAVTEQVAAVTQVKAPSIARLPPESKPAEPAPPVVAPTNPPPLTPAVAQLDLSRIALTNDIKLKEQAAKLNSEIVDLNKKSEDIELWKIALVGEDQVNKLQTKRSSASVKKYVQQSYQSQ